MLIGRIQFLTKDWFGIIPQKAEHGNSGYFSLLCQGDLLK